jgi:hypothetical protein
MIQRVNSPPLRVDVAPVGYYIDRVIVPIQQHNSDRLYILRARKDSEDLASAFREEIIRQLKKWKPGLDIRTVRTDLWTMESAVESFSAIIRGEVRDGNSVWVNLSTGSKLEAVAAAVACMAHGGTPYYVEMKSYERPDLRHPLAEGVKSVYTVPTFGLASPGAGGLAILELLAQNDPGLSKKSLISGLTELGLLPSDSSGQSLQARYARLQVILNRLTEIPALVAIEGHRRAGRVKITESGRLALRIFSPREGLGNPS